MADSVLVPGARDVRGTIDRAGNGTTRCVVACPPHPQLGGSRRDFRLRRLRDALVERDVDCLRFDYGPWDEGVCEQTDAGNAIRWARERYDRVALFGYSFGASIALLVAAEEPDLAAVSVLAPGADVIDRDDIVAAVDRIDAPLQVVVGERDTTVDWEPVGTRARQRGARVETVDDDHQFLSQPVETAEMAAAFLTSRIDR